MGRPSAPLVVPCPQGALGPLTYRVNPRVYRYPAGRNTRWPRAPPSPNMRGMTPPFNPAGAGHRTRLIIALAGSFIVFAMLLNSVGTVILQSMTSFGVAKPQASYLELFK